MTRWTLVILNPFSHDWQSLASLLRLQTLGRTTRVVFAQYEQKRKELHSSRSPGGVGGVPKPLLFGAYIEKERCRL